MSWPGAAGAGGAINISGGEGGTSTGGSIAIKSGDSSSSFSGEIAVGTPNSGSSGVSGNAIFSTGQASSGASGSISIGSGKASGGAGGAVSITVGEGNTSGGGTLTLKTLSALVIMQNFTRLYRGWQLDVSWWSRLRQQRSQQTSCGMRGLLPTPCTFALQTCTGQANTVFRGRRAGRSCAW